MINPAQRELVAARPLYRLEAYVFKKGNDGWKNTTPTDNCDFEVSENEFYIDGNRIACENDGKQIFGNAISKTAHFTVTASDNYSAEDFSGACIVVFINAHSGTDTITITGDYFFVNDVRRTGNLIEISASDIMCLADKQYKASVEFPCELKDIYNDVLQQCGMNAEYDTFRNSGFTVYFEPKGYTCRQILSYIAMAALGNAVADAGYPSVIIKPLILKSLHTDPYNEFSQWEHIEDGAEAIQFTGFRMLQTVDSDGQAVDPPIEKRTLVYSDDYAIELNNPLLKGNEDAVIEYYAGVLTWREKYRFRRFNGTHINYPLAEYGDLSRITYGTEDFFTYISKIIWELNGYTEISCDITGNDEAEEISYGGGDTRDYGSSSGGGEFPYQIGTNLKVTGDVLDVNTTNRIENGNYRPVTSHAVYTCVGNIEALLERI